MCLAELRREARWCAESLCVILGHIADMLQIPRPGARFYKKLLLRRPWELSPSNWIWIIAIGHIVRRLECWQNPSDLF